jgi:hypothetical protein
VTFNVVCTTSTSCSITFSLPTEGMLLMVIHSSQPLSPANSPLKIVRKRGKYKYKTGFKM